MSKRVKIKHLIESGQSGERTTVSGWVRTFRSNRFVNLNDGSCLASLQIVVDFETMDEKILKQITTGAAISVSGEIVESQGRGQRIEMIAEEITIHGVSDPDKYPYNPKNIALNFCEKSLI